MMEVKEPRLTQSTHLSVLDHHLSLIEKQVRMLAEFAYAAPVVTQPEGAVSLIAQQRITELLELLKMEISIARISIRKAADSSGFDL